MTPGFSLRRLFNRRRYMRALVATDPNRTVACCVEYWASRWRSTLEETPGVPEQLTYNGWVGTEIADGADTWRMLAAVPIDAIARSDLSPSASAQPGRSALLHGDRPSRIRAMVLRHPRGPPEHAPHRTIYRPMPPRPDSSTSASGATAGGTRIHLWRRHTQGTLLFVQQRADNSPSRQKEVRSQTPPFLR